MAFATSDLPLLARYHVVARGLALFSFNRRRRQREGKIRRLSV